MTVPAAAPGPTYKMKDLCELTGLSRQAIHFYIQQGLLPEGRKTGRNMAWYGPAHLERLQLIRRLQEEQFLPLKAIRAILDAETADLDPGKRAILAEVSARLDASLQRPAPAMVDAADACARRGVPPADLARMIELGLVAARGELVSSDSLWLLDLWGQFRALGFSEALGFTVDELQVYEEAITGLFRRETALMVDRLPSVDPAQIASMLGRAMPLVHALMIHFHTAAVRNFFTAIERR